MMSNCKAQAAAGLLLLLGGAGLAACDSPPAPPHAKTVKTAAASGTALAGSTASSAPHSSALPAGSSASVKPKPKPAAKQIPCKGKGSSKPITLWKLVAEHKQTTAYGGIVYVLVSDHKQIQAHAVPADGAASEPIATFPLTTKVSSFAVDARGVYFATDKGIQHVSRPPAPPAVVAEQPLDRIALFGDVIYGSIFDRRQRTDTLVRVPKAGGKATVIESRSTWSIRSLAVGDRYVYVADSDGSAVHGIYRVPRSGGAVEEIFKDRGFFRQMYLDGGVLYWFTYVQLYRLPEAGSATPFWKGGYSIWASPTSADDSHLYSFEVAHLADAGWLYRISKADGKASKVDSFRDDLLALDVDDECLYLLRRDRPTGQLTLQAIGKPAP